MTRTKNTDLAFPTTVDDLTSEWLTDILRRSGRIDDQNSVCAFTSERVGNGLLGESVRITLEYDEPAESAPSSVVCKFPAEDPACRATGVREKVYKREISFYSDLHDIVAVRAPRPIHVARGAQDDAFVLVLEDLAPAVSGDQIAGCSVAQAEVVMDTAAALHGPLWGNPDLDKADWNIRPTWIPAIQHTYPSVFAEFREAFAEWHTGQEFAIGERLSRVIGRWFDEQPRPWTMTHGDYRLDNMLFDIMGGAEPLAILDWQTILPAPGVTDIAFFLGGCLTTELRRENEIALLRRYHDGLAAHGVADYGFDQLLTDYRYNAFMGYFQCSFAAMLVTRTERGDRMFSVWLQRAAAQIADNDSMDLLPKH